MKYKKSSESDFLENNVFEETDEISKVFYVASFCEKT